MKEFRLKIAIISDLHCHPYNEKQDPCTYMLSDKLRFPTHEHPVESLLHVINTEKLNVDLTLCPGDFTDKANLQGLISGWNFSLEINEELKSKNIVATVGNHDVDVYKSNSNYSTKNVKGIRRGFPMKGEDNCNNFWAKGCAFFEQDDYRILVINSSHFHYDKENSHNGEISSESLDYINQYLSEHKDNKIQIAMSHHPPIAHPRKNLGEDDKIVNGDKLLTLLAQNSFDLFIYGHKHDPFIKYYNTEAGDRITLFSSGSFSAGTNIMFAGLRNAFHTVELVKKANVCKGQICTWTYLPEDGWKKNYDESAFAPFAGFGNQKSVDEIYELIRDLLANIKTMSWQDLLHQIEDVKYLIPADGKKLHNLLKSNKYNLDEHLMNNPTQIYNLNLL